MRHRVRSFGSLYQHPPRALRTSEESAIFGRSLNVMADMCTRDLALEHEQIQIRYCLPAHAMFLTPDASRDAPDASAIGTTVLQIKEIPERPPEFDGALCLFGVPEAALCLFGIGEAEICDRLRAFGDITSYEAGAGSTPTIVRFSTHDAAIAVKQAASTLSYLCDGIDTLYNERSYDGRAGEEGRDDDNGRGWCAFDLSFSVSSLPPTHVVFYAHDFSARQVHHRVLLERRAALTSDGRPKNAYRTPAAATQDDPYQQ